MNSIFVKVALVIVFVVIVACNIVYSLVLREVNHDRTEPERISRFENSRIFEALELHRDSYPQSTKRLMIWSLMGAGFLTIMAVVALDVFH